MDQLTCELCGKQMSRNQAAVSNWGVISNKMTCGECQGLTDFPQHIKSFGKAGKTALQINISVSAAALGSIKSPKKSASRKK